MVTITTLAELQDQLVHYHGTQNYYRHGLTGMLYTDGVRAMTEREAAKYAALRAWLHLRFCESFAATIPKAARELTATTEQMTKARKRLYAAIEQERRKETR